MLSSPPNVRRADHDESLALIRLKERYATTEIKIGRDLKALRDQQTQDGVTCVLYRALLLLFGFVSCCHHPAGIPGQVPQPSPHPQ